MDTKSLYLDWKYCFSTKSRYVIDIRYLESLKVHKTPNKTVNWKFGFVSQIKDLDCATSDLPTKTSFWVRSLYGDDCIGDTPVSIPNTEVKPYNADGTARATLW